MRERRSLIIHLILFAFTFFLIAVDLRYVCKAGDQKRFLLLSAPRLLNPFLSLAVQGDSIFASSQQKLYLLSHGASCPDGSMDRLLPTSRRSRNPTLQCKFWPFSLL